MAFAFKNDKKRTCFLGMKLEFACIDCFQCKGGSIVWSIVVCDVVHYLPYLVFYLTDRTRSIARARFEV